MNFKLLLFTLFFSFCIKSYSQIGGNNTYEFLNLPISARAAALGGNVLSIRDNDINLAVLNPSLLNKTMNNHLALSYINYFSDINLGYAGYSKTIDKLGSFNAGMQYINYGKFTRAEDNGEITGAFSAGEYALNLGWGRQLDSSFSIGSNFKTIYSTLEQYQSLGVAVDLAGTYFNERLKFGTTLLVKNIGTQIIAYRKGNKEPLPFEIQLGLSKQLEHAPFRFSMVLENLEKFDLTYRDTTKTGVNINPITGEEIHEKIGFFGKSLRHVVIGGEFLPSKNFNIRIGYNYQRRQELKLTTRGGISGFSWGFGFRISKFHISYSRATYHLAGASNHFTISTSLSSFNREGP